MDRLAFLQLPARGKRRPSSRAILWWRQGDSNPWNRVVLAVLATALAALISPAPARAENSYPVASKGAGVRIPHGSNDETAASAILAASEPRHSETRSEKVHAHLAAARGEAH